LLHYFKYFSFLELNEKQADLYKDALDNMIRQPPNTLKWWREAIEKFKMR
jgi:hypothetical protein